MSRPGFFWRKWLEGSSRWIYVGMCPVEMLEGSESAVVGRAGDKFVLYISAPSRRWDGEGDLFKGAGPRVQGLFSAKPVLIKGSLGMLVEGPHSGAFKPLCIPPLGGSRWWVFSTMDWSFFEEHGLNYPPGDHALYVLTESGISQYCSPCHEFNSTAHSLCKFAFGGKWLYHSPVGPPVSAPGAGALNDAELSVIRFRDRYLRVGEWIAWHRVLGILDDGKWVIIGDDGLYEAVFRPTAKNLAEDFGEVGYVKVLAPYAGDVDDVQSPCGAPRLVACSEEGLRAAEALLKYIEGLLKSSGVYDVIKFLPRAWTCEKPFVIPELVEINVPNEVVADWPLGNPCPHVLRAADGDPLGLLTTRTWYFCWTP